SPARVRARPDGARSRRDLRLRTLRAPRPRDPEAPGGDPTGMTDPLLLYADTERSADLFHAVPFALVHPFLYAEFDDRRVAAISVLDADKVREAGVETHDPSEFGRDELLGSGLTRVEVELEVALRACRELGIGRAAVPVDFPLAPADHLRAGGVELVVDDE